MVSGTGYKVKARLQVGHALSINFLRGFARCVRSNHTNTFIRAAMVVKTPRKCSSGLIAVKQSIYARGAVQIIFSDAVTPTKNAFELPIVVFF